MKTAIILRGHARTWNYIKQNITNLFNELYNYPDWYVIMPNTNTVTEESLTEDFRGSNIKLIKLVSDDHYPFKNDHLSFIRWKYYTPSYWRLAWLDYLGGVSKRRYELENNIRYTNVYGIRPDIRFELQPDSIAKYITELEMMEMANTCGQVLDFNDWLSTDFLWRGGSAAADIYCMRFLDTYFTDGIPNQLINPRETTIPPYYQARNFINGIKNTGNFKEDIVTPNRTFPLDDEILHTTAKQEWSHLLSPEDRRRMCIDLNIDPKDYQL